MDIKQLYDALVAADVGATVPSGANLSHLETLFIAHGLFADADGNKGYDEGEVIGQVTGKDRPGRRKVPRQPGSFIAADAADAATGAPVAIRDFSISRCYAPPLAERNHAWSQRPDVATGILYVYGTDPQFQATAFIVAHAPGYRPSAPLALRNADYWALMATEPADFFLQHTFRLERGSEIYLPSVRAGHGTGLALGAASPAADAGRSAASEAQDAQPPVRCGLEPQVSPATAGPSPTRRPTARPMDTPTVGASATPTPSESSTASPGATPTPIDPSPTPKTGPAQRAAGATTTDAANQSRTVFVSGDAIWLWGLLANDEAQAVERDVEFVVTAEGGVVEERLTWRGRLSLPPGAQWFRSEAQLGSDVAPGLYRLAVTVIAGGERTSQHSAVYIARGLIRAEDFADQAGGWPTGDTVDAAYGYAGGEYRIGFKSAGKTLWSTGGTRAEDLIMEGDVRITAGTGAAALMLGLNDAGTDFTIFGIDAGGRFGLFRSIDTGWRALVPWTASPAVPLVGTAGHLMLSRRGDRLRLFIGGVELAPPPAELVPAGRLGVYGEAVDAGLEGRFDNVRVYGP